MTHEERMEIARQVASRIVEKYGERVSAVAVYGSLAKNEDGPHSDIDMWVATTEPIEDTRFFVYGGVPVSVAWSTEEQRFASASRVTPFWPLDADELRSFLVLYERGGFIAKLNRAASHLQEEDFVSSIRVLMARAFESTNKVRNARLVGDHYRLLVEGRWLALEAGLLLGLLNRRYYPGGRGFYQLSMKMPRQPRDYASLLNLAGGFTTTKPDEVHDAAVALWANLCDLVREEGIEWEWDRVPF